MPTAPRIYGLVGILIIIVTYAILAGKLPTTGRAYADSAKVVSYFADGQKRIFTTDASTVGEVLARTNSKLGPHDLVEPAANTQIPTGFFNINVYRARPVLVQDGTTEKMVDSPHGSPRLITGDAGINTYPEDQFSDAFVTNFVGDGTVGEKVVVKRAKPVVLSVDGATRQLRTQATTVAGLLQEKHIPMGEQDTTSVPLSNQIVPGENITITRVTEVVVTKHEDLANHIQTVRDDSMYQGESRVVEAGSVGGRDVTYKINYHDGIEVQRQVLNVANLVNPVNRVIHVGTKIRDDVWYRLRVCETGNNYTRNSGNGYYGAYQFDLGTWQSNGGTGLPSDADPATQDAIAKVVQARRGWSPWPVCSVKLGLI